MQHRIGYQLSTLNSYIAVAQDQSDCFIGKGYKDMNIMVLSETWWAESAVTADCNAFATDFTTCHAEVLLTLCLHSTCIVLSLF